MRINRFLPIFLILNILLQACSSNSTVQTEYKPGYFQVVFDPQPRLVISDGPGSIERSVIPLDPPTDCSFYSLRPAPKGRWLAIEWECSFGPAVELLDAASGKTRFALANPSIDSRFLAWQPDGSAIYLKIGTLSVPQTLRIDVESGQALELPVSPFAYDLTVSPVTKKILYSLTKGIGFGSETWLAGPDGQNPSQLLLEPASIIALAQYSPDGSQLAYIKFPDNQVSTPTGELWLMNSDGSHQRRLASADAGRGLAPTWSPDGDRIAFPAPGPENEPALVNLTIIDLPTMKLTNISPSGTQPAWSPDGKMISFSSAAPINALGDTIYLDLFDIASGKITRLANGTCCAGWIR